MHIPEDNRRKDHRNSKRVFGKPEAQPENNIFIEDVPDVFDDKAFLEKPPTREEFEAANPTSSKTSSSSKTSDYVLPIIIGLVGFIIVLAAAFALIPNFVKSKDNPVHVVGSGTAFAYVQNAFDNSNLKFVSKTDMALRDLNRAKAAYESDPRQSYALNSAFKDQWRTEPVEHKVVYLTFDDGPSSMTPRVLDILDQYNAKATFFVTNQYPDCLDYIKLAYDKGHTIGLHTASHNYATVYASDEAYFNDLAVIGNIVKDRIGYVPCFVRLPGGSSNTISANYSKGIISRITAGLLSRGYQYYDWNASSGDGGTVNRDQAYDNAIKSAGGDSVVILCHDTPSKGSTADALPAIIEYYQSQGYVFKGIDRNTPITHHSIAN